MMVPTFLDNGLMKLIFSATYCGNYGSSAERTEDLAQQGFRLNFCLLNYTGITWIKHKTSSRKCGVGIILVIPVSEGDGNKEMK